MHYQVDRSLEALFPSRSRRAVLASVFSGAGESLSASDLARRADLTQRAISMEIRSLERAGLVRVEAIGSAHLVRPNLSHPVAGSLLQLFSPGRRADIGAPPESSPRFAPVPDSAIESLLDGLERAHSDAEALAALPGILARQAGSLDWDRLEDAARRRRLKAELGFLLDLTADLAGLPWLGDRARRLADGRRRVIRYLPEPSGEPERLLADARRIPAAERWSFRVNLDEDAFRVHLPCTLESGGSGTAVPTLAHALRAIEDGPGAPAEITLLEPGAAALRAGDAAARLPVRIAPEPPEPPPAHFPYSWRERRVAVAVPGLARLRVLVPERHDAAIAVASTGLATDLQRLESEHRREPFRLGVLVTRHHEAHAGPGCASPEGHLAFLALVERLFGTEARRRVEGRRAPVSSARWRPGRPPPRGPPAGPVLGRPGPSSRPSKGEPA